MDGIEWSSVCVPLTVRQSVCDCLSAWLPMLLVCTVLLTFCLSVCLCVSLCLPSSCSVCRSRVCLRSSFLSSCNSPSNRAISNCSWSGRQERERERLIPQRRMQNVPLKETLEKRSWFEIEQIQNQTSSGTFTEQPPLFIKMV